LNFVNFRRKMAGLIIVFVLSLYVSYSSCSAKEYTKEITPMEFRNIEECLEDYTKYMKMMDDYMAEMADLLKWRTEVEQNFTDLSERLKDLTLGITQNTMSISHIDDSVENQDKELILLRDDVEEYVHALNGNDSKIREDLNQELTEMSEEIDQEIGVINNKIDLINDNVDAIKEMPIGSIVSWVMKPDKNLEVEQSYQKDGFDVMEVRYPNHQCGRVEKHLILMVTCSSFVVDQTTRH